MLLTHIYMYFRKKKIRLLVIHHTVLPLVIVGRLFILFFYERKCMLQCMFAEIGLKFYRLCCI